MMRKDPTRGAWFVLLGAFATFLLLCAAVPFSVRYYLDHATTAKPATLEVIGGTVRVREPGAAAPIAVAKTLPLNEGSIIETDENSRCIITFLDGSTTTLFPNTQVTLREMHVATFSWGIEPTTIMLDQTRGRIRVGAAQQIAPAGGAPTSRLFQVFTQQLDAILAEGSYAVEVAADASQVIVTNGNATVTAQARTVQVARGQRTVARNNEPPLPALPAEQDLVVNGDFMDPLPRGWDDLRDASGDSGRINGSVKQTTLGDRQAIQITRANSNQTSAITGVVQQINREVSDYRTMRLAADVRVHYQGLSGGGILSSEYPLILRIKYRDVYGSEAEWVHGFYNQNTTNNPTVNGELVPQDVWVPFETGNLFDAVPRPFYITSLQIYASGWDYDSYVTAVRLIVE